MTDPNLEAVLAMPAVKLDGFQQPAQQPTCDREIARENLRSRGLPMTTLTIHAEMERIRQANDPEGRR